MRTLFVTFVIFSIATSLCAQTEANPFKKYGLKKVLMATFSKGEFEEFHKNKELVEIGSVVYNTKTKEVVGYMDETVENDIASSTPAMSIDPHCEKYPWITPYAYCLNNPVKFVDPDGRDIKSYNIIRLDNSGNPVVTRGLSSTTNAAMKDLVSTKEGKAFFAQFAKAGDVVGDHTFTKDEF